MKRLLGALAFILILQKPVLSQTFEEPFEDSEQVATRLGDILLLGKDGTWSGSVEKGRYVLTNDKEGAVKYFYMQRAGTGDQPQVSVDIAGQFAGANSSAGILYSFDPEAKTYFAFTVGSSKYTIWKRTSSGFQALITGSEESLDGPEPITLSAQPSEKGVEFLINGKRAGTVSNSDIDGTYAGLIAISTGEFRFDNLSIGPIGKRASLRHRMETPDELTAE